MTSNTISKQLREKHNYKFYVYYDEWTGNVTSVHSSIDKKSTADYIETESDYALQIIRNERTRNDFVVNYDENDELVLMERTESINLENRRGVISSVSNKKIKQWDIRFTIYTSDNKMVAELNPSSLRKTLAYHGSRTININNDNVSVYITQLNNPDMLIASIPIDTTALFTKGKVVCDIPHIESHVEIDDISLYTIKIFKNVYYTIETKKFEEPDSLLDYSKRINKITTQYTGKKEPHITLSQEGNRLRCERHVESEILLEHGLNQKQIKLFIIGNNPDEYFGSIVIKNADLQTKEHITIEDVPFDLSEINILHEYPLIRIKKRDQQ